MSSCISDEWKKKRKKKKNNKKDTKKREKSLSVPMRRLHPHLAKIYRNWDLFHLDIVMNTYTIYKCTYSLTQNIIDPMYIHIRVWCGSWLVVINFKWFEVCKRNKKKKRFKLKLKEKTFIGTSPVCYRWCIYNLFLRNL